MYLQYASYFLPPFPLAFFLSFRRPNSHAPEETVWEKSPFWCCPLNKAEQMGKPNIRKIKIYQEVINHITKAFAVGFL